jgi:RNA polymerase sigma-32 factor
MSITRAPHLHNEASLDRYLKQIRAIPMLHEGEEYMLAKRLQEHNDVEAAHRLVTSHLRLVAKMASKYMGYGLPLNEMISEGNIGLMQAVKKFDPEKGFRLSTYAMWWIKASIQEYVLRSWSLVKMGTTAAQKKLFFNLKRLKSLLKSSEKGDLTSEHVKSIATTLDVSEDEVVHMNRRLMGADYSLNASLKSDEDGGEWQDWLESPEDNQETVLGNIQEYETRSSLLNKALLTLNEREKHIIRARRLSEPQATLEDLSHEFGISRERVRQIENRAFEKIKDHISTLMLPAPKAALN